MADLDEELAQQSDSGDLDLDVDSSLEDLLTADAAEEDLIEQSRQRNERSGMGSVEPLADLDETEDTLESLGLDKLAESPSESPDNASELEFDLSSSEPVDVEAQLAEIDAELESLDFESADLTGTEAADDFEMDLMADLDSILDDTDQVEEPEVDLGADLDFELTDEVDLSNELDVPELSDVDSLDADVATAEPVNDLDLAGIELDDAEDSLPKTPSDAEVTEELTSNIEHDLDAELDGELEALLNSTDNEIALEETVLDDEPVLDSLGLLDGADEVETKLDLARAYIDMDDAEGAKDILQEILQEGNEAQKAEATGLMEGLA
jgi:pilus assembly protein FimV